jgi:hypothetical protein
MSIRVRISLRMWFFDGFTRLVEGKLEVLHLGAHKDATYHKQHSSKA